jgi:hypothetical protein
VTRFGGAVVAGLLAAATLAALAACGPGAAGPGSPVEGVVVDVETEGIADVRGFTLRTGDGRELVFTIGKLENATEVSPTHLVEHLASSEPVRVFFRAEDGDLVVHRLEVLHAHGGEG